MNQINIIFAIVISLFLFLENNYCQSDSYYYIAAKNGLFIRSSPSIDSKKIQKIGFNELIKVSKTDIVDTIDNRIDVWCKLVENSEEGYVFGGYLNKNLLPELDSITGILNDYIPKFVKQFGNLEGNSFRFEPVNDSKGHKTLGFYQNDRVVVTNRSGYEYSITKYYFKDFDINEFINLFDLMNVYYYENTVLIPKFEYGNFEKFSYSIPDAGMGNNQVIQINKNDVLVIFEWSL